MLDGDICIDFQRRRSAKVVERMLALQAGEAVLSFVTYGELQVGAQKSASRERALAALQTVTSAFPVALPSEQTSEHYAVIRAYLERRGELIGSNDLWIAAHARSAELTLVTNNEGEFRRVPGLSVENWAAESE